MKEIMVQYVSIAAQGVAIGGGMGGIVILIDYVITSVFSMMKGGI